SSAATAARGARDPWNLKALIWKIKTGLRFPKTESGFSKSGFRFLETESVFSQNKSKNPPSNFLRPGDPCQHGIRESSV
ncbi:MAG TPA: hypothetical protein PK490_05265, partial [Prosthecobacter sp.]|nr:hypothetical protein [Prosthecobacter sp.]HRK13673.1 hypothetical protein [Prosthecobacter sp.]